MSYTVNNTRGSVVSTVNNGTTASVGGITLIGKNYTGYGELIAEDFVKILENNANTQGNEPASPLEGQLFWDTTNQSLKVYNSSTQWHPITVHVGTTYPHTATIGALWFNTTTGQLNVNSNGTVSGYKQLATASESSSSEVITLTATQVDDNASNANGYSASDSIEVIAQVLTKGDGTSKDVIQVWSPAHFSFANPNNAGSVEQAIYDTFTANITVSSTETSTQGTLIRGANVQDNLISEGVEADSLSTAGQTVIVNSARNFQIVTADGTVGAGNVGTQLGVNTTASPITITLPAAPSAGDVVSLVDSHHQWGSNTCTVARNGNTIDGATSDLTLNQTAQQISLMYNGAGWRTFNKLAVYG
jgi:hypothetical protein